MKEEDTYSSRSHTGNQEFKKRKFSECDDILISDVEDDDEKNIPCDFRNEKCEVENLERLPTVKYCHNSSRKKMLDELFVKMIALDMEPLRLSEREGIKEFVAGLDSRYELPGRSTVTANLSKLFMKMKIQLLKIVEGTRYVAITADTWTSMSNQGILTLTCHLLKENQLISALLAAKVVEGHHNADNLASKSFHLLVFLTKLMLDAGFVKVETTKLFDLAGYFIDFRRVELSQQSGGHCRG
ncbi:hypothetical protein evm_010792 [Chilo suppressalis]|nr:hypothetical protein evm_010792 [Chilo suppressalis]